MADMEFTADFSDLHTLNRLLDSEIPKSAQQSASVFETQFSRVEKQLRLSSQASEAFYKKTLGIEESVKSARQSYSAFLPLLKEQERQEKAIARAMDQHSAEVESLRMKYDTAYRAQKQYDAGLDEVRMAHYAGAISAERMAQEIEEIGIQYERVKKGQGQWTNQFVTNSAIAGKSMNKFGMYAQQVGYQVGDLFVQIQSGANFFVAFGQQATQLAGLLPGVIGAVAVFGISVSTMFLAMWDRSKKAKQGLDETKEAAEELESNLKSLESTVKDYLRTQEEMRRGVTAEELFGIQSIEKTKEDLAETRVELEKLYDAQEAAQLSGGGAFAYLATSFGESQQLEKIQTLLNKITDTEVLLANLRAKQSAERSEQFASSFSDIHREIQLLQVKSKYGADSVEYIAKEAEQRKNLYAEQLRGTDLTKEQQAVLVKVNNELVDAEANAQRVAIQNENAANAARDMESAIKAAAAAMSTLEGVGLKVEKAIGVASAKIDALRSGANAAIAGNIAAMQSDLEAARSKALEGGNDPLLVNAEYAIDLAALDELKTKLTEVSELEEQRREAKKAAGAAAKKAGGIGGDSGIGGDAYAFLRNVLGSESKEVQMAELAVWYDEALLRLQTFNEKELAVLEKHGIDKTALDEEYARRKLEIENKTYAGIVSAQEAAKGALSTLMSTIGSQSEGAAKAVLAINTGLSIAQAYQNTAVAATRALAELGPVAGPAAAQSIWTYGKAQIGLIAANAALKLGSSGSGGSGGSSGGGSNSIATTSTASTAPQQVLIQGLTPGMRLTPEELQTMFDQIYEENDRRGTVFTIAGV